MKFSIKNARELDATGSHQLALINYLTVLRAVSVDDRQRFFQEFLNCVQRFCVRDDTLSGPSITRVSKPILELYPNEARLYNALGEALCRCNLYTDASAILSEMLTKADPSVEERSLARLCHANRTTHMFPSWHMIMINDINRNALYKMAIEKCVSSESVCLEIGSGTGLLTVLCCSICNDVQTVEDDEQLYNITKDVIALNASRMCSVPRCLNMNSKQYCNDDRQITVVLSEIMDCCAFGEGLLETYHDIHTRLDLTSAVFIPSKITLFVKLIESPTIYREHAFDRYRSKYVNLGSEEPEEPYWCTHLSDYSDVRYLSDPIPLLNVSLANREDIARCFSGIKGVLQNIVTEPGVLHCFVVHFVADLCDGIRLDTSAGDNICWETAVFPLAVPQRVEKGDSIPMSWILQKDRFDVICPENVPMVSQNEDEKLVVCSQDDISVCNDLSFSEEVISCLPSGSRRIILSRRMSFVVPYIRSGEFVWKESADNGELGCMYELVGMDISLNGDYIHHRIDSSVWWPVAADGSLLSDELHRLHRAHRCWSSMSMANHTISDEITPQHTLTCFPAVLSCHGQLISSRRLSTLCRPDTSAHCGVDLSPVLKPYTLTEYRDINLDAFEHEMCSDEFSIYDFELQETARKAGDLSYQPAYNNTTRSIQVPCTLDGVIEGVVYWWKTGSYSSKANKVAAFIFKEPVVATSGQVIPVRFDCFSSVMLMSYENR